MRLLGQISRLRPRTECARPRSAASIFPQPLRGVDGKWAAGAEIIFETGLFGAATRDVKCRQRDRAKGVQNARQAPDVPPARRRAPRTLRASEKKSKRVSAATRFSQKVGEGPRRRPWRSMGEPIQRSRSTAMYTLKPRKPIGQRGQRSEGAVAFGDGRKERREPGAELAGKWRIAARAGAHRRDRRSASRDLRTRGFGRHVVVVEARADRRLGSHAPDRAALNLRQMASCASWARRGARRSSSVLFMRKKARAMISS